MLSGTASVGGAAVAVASAEISVFDPGQAIDLSLTDTAQTPVALTAVGEDGGARVVRVTATAPAAVSAETVVSVTVGAAGGSADPQSCAGSGQNEVCTGGDYAKSDPATITIPSGGTSGSVDVTVTPLEDTISEENETIRVGGSAGGYAVRGADLEITDQDRTVGIGVGEGEASYGEGGDPQSGWATRSQCMTSAPFSRTVTGRLGGLSAEGVFTASTSSTLGSNVRGRVRTVDGTATYNQDYSSDGFAVDTMPTAWEFITIAAGSTSGTATVQLVSCVDDVAEGDETYQMTISSLPAGFGADPQLMTVTDDDSRPGLRGSVSEDAGGTVGVEAFLPAGSSELTDPLVVSLTSVIAGQRGDG